MEISIVGKNIDAFGLILSTEQLLRDAKKTQGAVIKDTDSFTKGENSSYLIDYMVNSSSVGGTKCKGNIFIRGFKSESGIDSYKFCVEKLVDFAELDSQLIVNAVEHLLRL